MKRDLTLVREIMMYLEKELLPYQNISSIEMKKFHQDNIEYIILCEHITLLEENNLIECYFIKNLDNTVENKVLRITNSGHDFLDTFRNENIWNKTNEKLKEVGSYSFEFLLEIGKNHLKQQMGI